MLTLSAEEAAREVYECGVFDDANIADFILNSEVGVDIKAWSFRIFLNFETKHTFSYS